MARPSSIPLSLEQSLEDDYIETISMLGKNRTDSPARRKGSTGQSPAPGLLDVESSTPRHGSIAGIGVGVTSPRQQDKKTRLDPSDPSTWTTRHASKPNSPTLTKSQPAVAQQDPEPDDDWPQSYVGIPRAQSSPKHAPTQRSMSDAGPSRPRDSPRSGALAAALSGELDNVHITTPGSPEQNLQKAAGHSRSPSGRVIQNPATESPAALSPETQLTAGQHHASNSFSTLESGSDMGHVKVDPVGDEHVVAESSDEEHSADSEDESRGRERDRSAEEGEDAASPPSATETPTSPEPAISITSPDGEKVPESASTPQPHPKDAKNRRLSGSTHVSSDGDDNDIAKAKTLGLSISPLDTAVPDRHVRMIIRGDWDIIQKEAEAGDRNIRTYLACSDLSNEATYALEWTIGTILRDGDTLICVYSIEDETAGNGSGSNKVTEAEKEKLHEEGAQAGKDAMDAMEGLTRQTTNPVNAPITKFIPATEAKSLTGSVDARKVSKREMERLRAIDEITQTFLRLVRKTSLQVRCMIEVIHCKSPKHLILGAV